MSRYAEGTTVSVVKSRAEIEDTVIRYGASHFGSMLEPGRAVIAFRCKDRNVKFTLPLADPETLRTVRHKGRTFNTRRTDDQVRAAWEQDCRQRWRALALAIKAKLEAVETGITTFEEEFLAHIVMPDGRTVQEHVAPQIADFYTGGRRMPLLLGGGS